MRILRVLQEFSHSTSIHGFCYLVRPNGTTRSKIGFALCILAGLIYASLELRITVFCKFIDEESCKIVFMNNIYFFLIFIAWYTHPVKSVVVVLPLEDVPFPAVTLCPYSSSPDRWGTAVKILDHMDIKCESKE